MLRAIAGAGLLLAAAGGARAGNIEDCSSQALRETEPARAATACRALAEQGQAWAQFTLGGMYDDGVGVAHDDALAARWYLAAAEQGHARAQFFIAAKYNLGSGVEQDFDEAAKWYASAAERANPQAQLMLGALYANGRGVPLDNTQAHLWYSLAEAQGLEQAATGREGVAKLMSPEEIAEAERLFREWKPKPPQ